VGKVNLVEKKQEKMLILKSFNSFAKFTNMVGIVCTHERLVLLRPIFSAIGLNLLTSIYIKSNPTNLSLSLQFSPSLPPSLPLVLLPSLIH